MTQLNEFIDGQYACHKGWDADLESKSDAFQRGYAVQYELEQIKTDRTERQNAIINR